MRSGFELELTANWVHDALLREADAERLISQLPRRQTTPVRTRIAAVLYTVADWLNSDTPPHVELETA
jgi:hypothetical protein